jgi:hypothetical protein
LNINNEELIKKKIADKDKANLRYKEKLNSIKQHYGVEFYVEHLNNNDIENLQNEFDLLIKNVGGIER